jgi:hypothetical protein
LVYPFKPDVNENKRLLDKIMPHPYLLRMLREFLECREGDTVAFKNREQAVVTQLMVENERHIIYVSPTGK